VVALYQIQGGTAFRFTFAPLSRLMLVAQLFLFLLVDKVATRFEKQEGSASDLFTYLANNDMFS